MNLFEVKNTTIKLEPGLDWQWSGWNGEITIDVQQTTFQIDGNNGLAGVILPSDIQASSLKLIGKAYTTNTHNVPGIVSVALLEVTDSTLCDFVICENEKVAIKTTEGNFTITVIPAQTSSIPPILDPVITKTGTWTFVDAPQSIAGLESISIPDNVTVVPAQTSSIPPIPDPVITKTGTWTFVDAPQSIAGLESISIPDNVIYIASQISRARRGNSVQIGNRSKPTLIIDGQTYVGGEIYQNRDRTLPQVDEKDNTITYKEYDVNPYQPGVNRGSERLIIGSNGKQWYTNDHYRTFVNF